MIPGIVNDHSREYTLKDPLTRDATELRAGVPTTSRRRVFKNFPKEFP